MLPNRSTRNFTGWAGSQNLSSSVIISRGRVIEVDGGSTFELKTSTGYQSQLKMIEGD